MAGSVDEGNMQEGLGAWLLDSQDINICFSTSSMLPSSIEPEIISVTTVPSEKIFANPQAVVNDAGLAEGTGLNRKSVQKPKRKKHRPKVIKEGKAAKSQKSATPKPPKEKGNQPKRKYVRRKGLNTPPKQLPSEDVDTNTRAESSPARRFLNFDGKDRQENVDLSSQTQVTGITTFPEDLRSSISAVERSHVQVGHHWSGTSSSISAPFDPMANVQELPADSRANRVTFDLNNSVMNYMPSNFSDLIDGSGQNFQFDSRETEQINQLMDLYNGMPDTSVSHLNSSAKQTQNCSTNFDQYLYACQSSTNRPPRPAQMLHGYMMLENPAAPPQHVERVSMKGNFNPEACTRVNQMSQGYTVPENPIVPPKHSERDAVHEHFSELPVKNDYLKFSTNSSDQIGASFGAHDYHDLSHVHAIGKKREHNAINGHQVSFGVNFGHSSRESQFCNDPLSTSSQTYLSPETCKRMRTDDHRNWLNGLAGKFSSSSAYMSDNWDTNSVSTINHGPGVCTLADIQRLMALEKSRSSQQMIGFGVPENNMVQQHNKPTLDNNSGKYFAPPDKQLKCFTAQQTHFADSMSLLAENSTHRNGDHQLQALEIRPTEHYFSDCVVLPNEWSRYSTAGHTQFPSGTTNPSKENYIQSNRIHHLQPLEDHMVKAPDLLFEPHKTSTEDVIVSNYCTDIPDEQIVITSAEVVRSVSQPISESTKTENSHLEHPRESAAPNPTDKPKVRGRPRKKEEPNGKPKVRGRPRKEAEPSGKLKVRGRPRKETEPGGKPKVRGRPRKETEPSGKSIDVDTIRKEDVGRACPPNGDTDLNNESISFASAPCAGIMPRMTTFESERNRERISISFATSEHDKYSSIRSEKIYRGSIYEVSASSVGPLDALVEKLKLLNLFESEKTRAVVQQNAIVPYEIELGALVPFEEQINKRHSRPRVNMDPVTALVWNLLMEPDMCDGTEQMDKDKEKWLDEERRVFRGRIDSFIARMHLVQGDRRFSRWKGSVVDSVVGVFLTQNVSDHLSSSAFMAVAAKFPAKSEDPEKPAFEMSHTPPEQKDSCFGLFGESLKMQGNFFVEEISEIRLNNTEDNEGSNSNELIGCSRDGVNREARECPVSYRKSVSGSHENGPAEFVVPAIVTAGVVEVEDGSQEDVISSQNSAVSCQNSPDYLFHRTYTTGSSSLPSCTEEDYIVRNMPNGMGSSTAHSALAPMQDLQSMPSEKVGLSEYHESDLPTSCLNKGLLLDLNRTYQPVHTSYVQNSQFDLTGVSDGNHLDTSFLTDLDGVNISDVTQSEASLYQLPFDSITANRNNTKMPDSSSSFIYNLDGSLSQERCSFRSEPSHEPDFLPTVKQNFQQLFNSEEVQFSRDHSFCENRFSRNHTQDPFVEQHDCLNLQEGYTSRTKKMGGDQLQSGCSPQGTDIRVQATASEKHCSSNLTGNKNALSDVSQGVASDAIGKSKHSQKDPLEFPPDGSKARKVRGRPKKNAYDWDNLRKEVLCNYGDKQRSPDAKDTVDWEAVRQADVRDLSEAIRERGMNNMLAERIKEFLNRLVRDHGSIDLEWLRDVQPDKAKDYLLSIRGLGLKSVECIRLLTLHHMAFPVDTNVGRISVRLGWVPLQPLPESLQLHLLEMYPMLEHVQKYLWPRLCNLDQKTLYELHYQMITFGKVFCTKSKPNCNSCPLRAECKHFASAFASARLALPGPEEKSLVTSEAPNAAKSCRKTYIDSRPAGQLEWNAKHPEHVVCGDQQPIVEEPSSPEPEPESVETEEGPIEDLFGEDPDEIPTIDLNVQEFTRNLKNYMQANNIDIEDDDMSKALVALTPQAASIPTSKLKNVSRLRTEHQVYELPDSHPLLEGFDKRQTDDPCPYLLSIWTPGETPQSTDAPKAFCNSQETGKLCESSTCFTCNSTREMHSQKVRGTILIPCRTAMRGSFPLNGTYFQVNEVFADHYSSQNPIDVWRSWIWNLPRRTVYFGTSVPTIFRGLVTEEIQQCFWRGFVCVRGFDRTLRAPKPLYARLHFPASKVARGRRPGAAREEE